MREKDLQAPLSFDENVEIEDVPTYEGFIDYSDELLNNFLHEHGMAMTLDDIKMIDDKRENAIVAIADKHKLTDTSLQNPYEDVFAIRDITDEELIKCINLINS